MSGGVSGTGGFRPDTDFHTTDGDKLLGELSAAKGSGPSWLSFLDASQNLKPLAQQLAADGTLDAADVKKLVTDAKDYGQLTGQEKDALKGILRDHAGKLTAPAYEALAHFLGLSAAGRPQTTPTTPPTTTPTTPTTGTGTTTPTTGTGTTTPTTGTGATTPAASATITRVNGQLPAIGGKKYELKSDGTFGQVGGAAPRTDAEKADLAYRAGNALVDAPAGVLRGVGTALQERITANATSTYDAALRQAAASPTQAMDAEKARSGAAAQLLAVMEGADGPVTLNKAATAYLDRAIREPNETLRASMFRNVEGLKRSLSAENAGKVDHLKANVIPSTPPYDKWFGANNPTKTLEVRQYAHPECWDYGPDPVTSYKNMGLRETGHGTENGEEYWEFSGSMKDPNGRNPDQKVHVKLFKSHDEFMRDLDDPKVHAIFYTGHSNLGGNVSEAVKRGPEENGSKFVHLGMCRGQQNMFEVANKYPHAQLSTSRDPHYFHNMGSVVANTLKGMAGRESWEAIDRRSDVESNNMIRPHEDSRYQYLDTDRDGKMEIDPKGRDRFFDVIKREPEPRVTDLRPRPETRPVGDIDGARVVDGVNFARTLITYHVEHGPGNSAVKDLEGDRFFANGWFEGDPAKEPVRITEERGADGKPMYKVAINKQLSGQGTYSIGALVQYEIFKKFAEKDGRFTPDEKARALVATGTYLSYMYATSQESDSIMRAIGDRAGVPNLTFRKVYDAIETDGHGYATDGQVEALKRSVNIR